MRGWARGLTVVSYARNTAWTVVNNRGLPRQANTKALSDATRMVWCKCVCGWAAVAGGGRRDRGLGEPAVNTEEQDLEHTPELAGGGIRRAYSARG